MKKQPQKRNKAGAFTLRLDPKTRFAVDLLARKRKRPMTSVIEWALDLAIKDRENGLFEKSEGDGKPKNILDDVWDTDEADRFVKMALNYPHFLNFDEERLWKAIREDTSLFRDGKYPNYPAIRKQWELLKSKFGIKE